MWDDLDHFKLPTVEMLKSGALSTTLLSETLVEITNHYLDWAQHEPGAKHEVNKLKNEISTIENAYTIDLQMFIAKRFQEIPDNLKKNRELQVGWALNGNISFVEASARIITKKMELIEKQYKLENIQSRLSAAKNVLDVGRSILSAMKEELRNL
jgi:predicted P-loop ATPase